MMPSGARGAHPRASPAARWRSEPAAGAGGAGVASCSDACPYPPATEIDVPNKLAPPSCALAGHRQPGPRHRVAAHGGRRTASCRAWWRCRASASVAWRWAAATAARRRPGWKNGDAARGLHLRLPGAAHGHHAHPPSTARAHDRHRRHRHLQHPGSRAHARADRRMRCGARIRWRARLPAGPWRITREPCCPTSPAVLIVQATCSSPPPSWPRRR